MILPIRPVVLGGMATSEVSISSIEYDEVPASTEFTWLSAEERRRASRFVQERDGFRFRARRAMLRAVLGDYLSQTPESIEFDIVRAGKPVLRSYSHRCPEVFFSASTTRERAVVAVAAVPIGLDIETVRPGIWVESMAERVLTPQERQWVCSQASRDRAFIECWVRKEAVAKLVGNGLDEAMARTTVTPQCEALDVEIRLAQPWADTPLAVACNRRR